jgi:response regulator RpfG family c-di-GMP phosphodiesterase
MTKPVLLLSPNGDNLAPQLGFLPGQISYGNYKDIVTQIRTIRQEKVSGIIVDGNMPEEDLAKIVSGLRQANIKHKPELPFILLGVERKIERIETVLKTEDLKKYFK